MIPDSVVIPWGNGEIKKWFDGGGGLYDDVYVDLTFVETFERCGLDAPVDSFAAAFLAKEYPLCHANQQARYNLLQGLSPHASGYWKTILMPIVWIFRLKLTLQVLCRRVW